MEYIYSAWFKDTTLDPDDQDYEWVACFIINADNEEKAKSWGDHLAKRYSKRIETEVFQRSEIGTKTDSDFNDVKSWDSTPVILYGDEPSDEEIGW